MFATREIAASSLVCVSRCPEIHLFGIRAVCASGLFSSVQSVIGASFRVVCQCVLCNCVLSVASARKVQTIGYADGARRSLVGWCTVETAACVCVDLTTVIMCIRKYHLRIIRGLRDSVTFYEFYLHRSTLAVRSMDACVSGASRL